MSQKGKWEYFKAINDLNRHPLRLWMNLYLPSVKLAKKVRVGSLTAPGL